MAIASVAWILRRDDLAPEWNLIYTLSIFNKLENVSSSAASYIDPILWS